MPSKFFYFVFLFIAFFQISFADLESDKFCIALKDIPQVNSKGEQIKELQNFLKFKFGLNLKITSIYDFQTKNAIKKFQYSYAIKPTGIINVTTLYKLKELGNCNKEKEQIIKLIENNNINQPLNTPTLTVTSNQIRADEGQIQSDLITKLLNNQEKDKGIYISNPNRNLVEGDNLNGVQIYVVKPESAKYQYLYDAILNNPGVSSMVDLIHKNFILPKNISVYFQECKEENAFFQSESDTIIFCYELTDRNVNINTRTDFSTTTKIQQSIDFTFLHEMGHALVYYYDLPITGKEESAVDEFAMYILYTIHDEKSMDSAFEGINQMYSLAYADSLVTAENYDSYSDDHDLSLVRYYDLLKFILGLAPGWKSTYIGKETWQISESAASNVEATAARKIRSWNRLLEGKIRP